MLMISGVRPGQIGKQQAEECKCIKRDEPGMRFPDSIRRDTAVNPNNVDCADFKFFPHHNQIRSP